MLAVINYALNMYFCNLNLKEKSLKFDTLRTPIWSSG